VWWLVPALDRIVLQVLSSAVFGSRLRLRNTLRSFRSYARNGLIRSLLPPFRFSPTRAFDLPVRQLENARGRIAAQRSKQLHRRVMNQASWLTVICILFEAVVFFSLVGLYDLLVPAASQDAFDPFELFQGTSNHLREYIVTALLLLAIALIEPLYIAGGFALYLNRRTALEGWDLEVQLRRIAQRTDTRDEEAADRERSAATVVAALIVAFVSLLSVPTPAPAQEPSTQEAPAAQPSAPAESTQPQRPFRSKAKREVLDLLKDPQFQEYETRTLIEPLEKRPQPESKEENGDLGSFMHIVAQILRVLVWVLAGAALLYAAYWILRRLDWIRPPPRAQWTPPSTLFGLDVRPESLPEDVAAAAAQLARSGNLIGALSLLYRGALVALLHRDQIELLSGDTEADCLLKTRGRLAAPSYAYFSGLLSVWQSAAYAHRMPPQREVEQLASEWPNFFRAQTA